MEKWDGVNLTGNENSRGNRNTRRVNDKLVKYQGFVGRETMEKKLKEEKKAQWKAAVHKYLIGHIFVIFDTNFL